MSKCENCKYCKALPSGRYKTVTGHLVITDGKVFKCQKEKVKSIDFRGDEMICSEFDPQAESEGENADSD